MNARAPHQSHSLASTEFDAGCDLPVFAHVVDWLGTGIGDKLVAAFGGTTLNVPQVDNLTSGHRLTEALGREEAEELCEAVGGEVFYVPNRRLPVANQTALSDLSAGKTTRQIALELGLSDRHVRRLRARCHGTASPRSNRQRETCLELSMRGMWPREIASQLGIDPADAVGVVATAKAKLRNLAKRHDRDRMICDCRAMWLAGQDVAQISARLAVGEEAVKAILVRSYGTMSDARWAQHMAITTPSDATSAQFDTGLTGGNGPSGHSPS